MSSASNPEDTDHKARLALAGLFTTVGVTHFLSPDQFDAIIPPSLPNPRLLTLISGVAEICGGVGLLIPPVRKLAGIGLMLLLIAVYPANFQMLFNAIREKASPWWIGLLVFRLPWQFFFAYWLWRVAIRKAN